MKIGLLKYFTVVHRKRGEEYIDHTNMEMIILIEILTQNSLVRLILVYYVFKIIDHGWDRDFDVLNTRQVL
jgi:hypothetical protein